MPHLAHKIYMCTTAEQDQFLTRACGVARFTYNWALAECNRVRELTGKNPAMAALKKQWNSIKTEQFPWVYDSPKDANQDPFDNLNAAWSRFWREGKQGKFLVWDKFQKREMLQAGVQLSKMTFAPAFKSKRSHKSFYLSNDKFALQDKRVRIPLLGWVQLKEALRFDGKIMSGVVGHDGNGWYIAVAVDVVDAQYHQARVSDNQIGVDLGIKETATITNGDVYHNPKPFCRYARRLTIRQRRASRKYEVQKKQQQKSESSNLKKQYRVVAKVQARISNIRRDSQHKLTTKLCRENQAVVIETLNVSGMMQNRKLSKAIQDVGFYEIKRQLEYKAKRYGVHLQFADPFYPSSKLCSCCGWKKPTLKLNERTWRCEQCGTMHDRDVNAARNLLSLVKIPRGYSEIHASPDMSAVRGSGQESKVSA
jgi:putative transposase